jgi:hypothetical protein
MLRAMLPYSSKEIPPVIIGNNTHVNISSKNLAMFVSAGIKKDLLLPQAFFHYPQT